MNNHYTPVPIIDRTADVLNTVISSSDGIKAKDLLRKNPMPKTTFYRLLSSLVDNELLAYHAETDKYTLGQIFLSGYGVRDEQVWSLRDVSAPYLKSLACQVEETVKLAVVSGTCSYTIGIAESDRPMRISINLGSTFPLHVGAAGKIFMCQLGESSLQHYSAVCGTLGNRYTDKTILTMEALRQELLLTRKRGYAIDMGEFSPDIHAVALPVLDSAGQTIAAISVVYPAFKQGELDIPALAEKIRSTTLLISTKLNTQERSRTPAHLIYE